MQIYHTFIRKDSCRNKKNSRKAHLSIPFFQFGIYYFQFGTFKVKSVIPCLTFVS